METWRNEIVNDHNKRIQQTILKENKSRWVKSWFTRNCANDKILAMQIHGRGTNQNLSSLRFWDTKKNRPISARRQDLVSVNEKRTYQIKDFAVSTDRGLKIVIRKKGIYDAGAC